MNKILILLATLLLTACASSTVITQPVNLGDASKTVYSEIEVNNNQTEAPDHFIVAVESYLKQELDATSQYQETAGRKIIITVNSYRMRSGFSRAMFGVLAGKDGIDSEVTIVDVESGEILGKSTVSSYNMMAIGGMEDIARMHAEEIAKFLNGSKS